jgi:autotransporter-associated beta strand protein
MIDVISLATTPMFHRLRRASMAAFAVFLTCGALNAAPSDPWTRGTGLFNDTTLGALKTALTDEQKAWPWTVNYDVNLSTWRYDVYVPPHYDGTKPFGVVVYTSSDNIGVVRSGAATDRDVIWIAPRNVGNNAADQTNRFGASLLAFHRAKELFNIDPRRIYISGKSGGARVASALAFLHSEIIRGTCPSVGFCLPRFDEVTPNFIPETSSNTDSYYNYSIGWLYGEDLDLLNSTAITNKLRSYLITGEDDHREEYFVEAYHCAYEPQGLTTFLYDGPRGHVDASDDEMRAAIDYLDRDDTFPIDANRNNSFAGLSDISQAGATLSTPTIGSGQSAFTVKRLTPTATAVAAVKSDNAVYWDNRNGSTFRWLWEVSAASPQNQKTNFGVWFANETWGGGPPTSLTAGTNPGILITITQTAAGNRMIISARPDSGGETVFYNGLFSFVPAYSTAQTNTQTGYLSGTGSPVEIRLEVNEKRFQLNFNGIKLDGATTTLANGVRISRDTKRAITGYWDSALGTAFWKHDSFTSWVNTWSPFTKSIFTASTGAVDSAGATPAPMDLRYVLVSDPGLPDPPQPGPTSLAASSSNGVVNLTWNSVVGATSYTLQRSSVSGGPYTTIQSGISGTSFTDSSVTSGNIYYYTIFATTPSGDTATVPELAAGAGFQVVTWTGGDTDNNWQSAANWNTTPVANDTLTFAGSTRLSNTNNYPANTSFRDLIFNSGAGAFTLAGNAVTLTGGVANNGANTQTVNLPMTLASGAHDITTSSGALTLGGAISGSGGLAKTGTGTTRLVASNTYNGGTTISGGTLGFASANGTNTNLGTGSVTVNTGAILRAGYSVTSNQNISTTANTITLAGGTIYADDANQHLSGAITVSASGGVLGSTYNNGSNSAAERDKGLALDGVVSGSGALTIQHSRIHTGQNYDTSFVAFSNNANTYSGTITINENTGTNEGGVYLGVNGGTALQNATIATSAIPGTNLKFGSSPIVFKTGLGTATLGAISGSGPLVLTGYDQVNHAYGSDAIALTVGGNNATTTYSGAISGSGSLVKAGTGILALTGANTYSGGTTLNSGTLGFANANGANTHLGAGSVTVNTGAILRPGYSVTSNQNISTTANAITLAGGSIYADDANQHLNGAVNVSTSGILGSTYNAGNNSAAERDKGLALDGVVSGAGALTIQHSRISAGNNYHTSFVAFSNNSNSYSGTITINENTTASEGGVYLGVNGSTALQSATIATSAILGSNLRFGSSPIVFKTGLGTATIGAISGSGPLVLTGYDQVNHAYGTDAIALTVGGNNATTTYSAAISGLGSLVKAGTGTLTLPGTSTYAGATTINGGILNLTGALSSTAGTVTVNNGGTLAGTGTVARATTVASSGAVSPGNGGAGAAGTLTLSSGLTFNAGAVLNMDLVGTTTSDKIAVSGAFSASGTATINLTALAGFAGSGSYTLITGATGISAGNFTVGSTPAGYVCTLSANNGALVATLMTSAENWRQTNFGTTSNSGNAADSADPDADGMTNASEYMAGTDPQNPASALRVNSIATNANDVAMSFPSVAGKTYRLERSETLQNGSWLPVQENIAGTGGDLQVVDPGGMAETKRFYRLVVVP